VREYLDKPVEDEKVKVVLEAGRLAPSASNRQEWKFIVVREHETRRRLAEAASDQSRRDVISTGIDKVYVELS
jgi:nitroreductase